MTSTVTIPPEKFAQARARILSVLYGKAFKVTIVHKLVKSLRYVATCFSPARAFYQTLLVFETSFRRFDRIELTPDVVEDLTWIFAVLAYEHRLNSIPVVEFDPISTLAIFVCIDASDTGLCALAPQIKQYLRVKRKTTKAILSNENRKFYKRLRASERRPGSSALGTYLVEANKQR
ncbi:LOW QUALITY PROTEIN: Hypothetical protein PHPALM_8536 [Phytophthora palmivora]|uniref:Uncharacterized protein n=1 Tax=Phytophthora palmivora TaxID=4796 RepID=A0A2P4YA02_9STRA|nr:LOW QUALITY PROTEIN: Hypothetical protein PHPALM_8536 [Phytophthora palmivora]